MTGLSPIVVLALMLSTTVVADPVREPRSFVQRESDIAVEQPGPHEGTGRTIAFPFFESELDLDFVFRKRILLPGASIGAHRNDKDEIYYVVSGRAELILQGEVREMGAREAVLTRNGHTHGLRQIGGENLVIFVIYPKHASVP